MFLALPQVPLTLGNAVTIFPTPVLGVIVFLTGAQLALGSCDFGPGRNERFVSLVVAATTVWNVGLAFVFGMALHHALKRRWVKL